MSEQRFCEFTGNVDHSWDEVGYKELCNYAGFEHCILYDKPLAIHEGWRLCCKECENPIQIKEMIDVYGS